MDAVFKPLADALGASVDQFKLIACLLASYPLGSVFVRLPTGAPALKHVFSIAVSLFYLLPMLNLWSGTAQLLFSMLGTYVIARTVHTSTMPWIVFWFTMGHLLVNHIVRAVLDLGYDTFEITGPQMVLTMKLTTFAWNVYDGRRPTEDLDKWQLSKRITRFPSILEFLGYGFYFPGMLVGPYLEYEAYVALITGSLFSDVERRENAVALKKGSILPTGRKRVAFRKLFEGLVWLGLFVTQYGTFNFGLALQPWFVTKPLWYRIGFQQICGIFERAKYYALWTLTEGASIQTGLGFTGYDAASGASQWTGAANVQVAKIELAPNFKVLLDSWNMKTNVWLRECVYKRVTSKGKKPGFKSSMLTFATSALWHGIYPGYYLTFIFGGFVTTAGRQLRASLRPLFLTAPPTPALRAPPAGANGTATAPPPPPAPKGTALKPLYDAVGTLCTMLILNYTAAPFMLLNVSDSLIAWGRLGWYGHIMIGGTLAFFWAGGGRVLKRSRKKAGPSPSPYASPAGAQTPGVGVMPPVDLAISEVERKLQ